MNNRTFNKMFWETYNKCGGSKTDKPGIREAYANYIDSCERDGVITESEAFRFTLSEWLWK